MVVGSGSIGTEFCGGVGSSDARFKGDGAWRRVFLSSVLGWWRVLWSWVFI